MTDHDIHTLLDIACGPPVSTALDPRTAASVADLAAADLRRAHAARTRRRARYAAFGATGLAVVTVGGIGVAGLRERMPGPGTAGSDPAPHHATYGRTDRSGSGIRLVAKSLDAPPYTFATTPAGWAVQGSTAFAVTIAPVDGSVSGDPEDFRGKLVITLGHGSQAGEPLDFGGRAFVRRGDSGYTILATHTRAGEPDGWVTVQFPDDTGWTTDTMLRFLSTVHVTSSAKAGHG